MANNELLEQVITHIKDHPETHNQEVWATCANRFNPKDVENCGTAACFAGWAVLLTHGRFHDEDFDVETEATRLLDISWDDAQVMFWSDNKRENLALMVKDLQNGESLEDNWHVPRDENGMELEPDSGYVRRD